LVFQVEQFLNSPSFKQEFPDTGEDVKVFAMREGRDVSLTVAMPFLAPAIRTESQYFARKRSALQAINQFVSKHAGPGLRMQIDLNALDCREAGLAGMYLSLLGTSAEGGDSGEVGQGNRVCGVIALRRPASAEAAAGKNPLAHVGKIDNVLAQVLAEDIVHKAKGLCEVTVWLTSQIGKPISTPQSVMVEVAAPQDVLKAVGPLIRQRVQLALKRIATFCHALARGVYAVC
jgi:S-adenosylmethionine synthetase